MAGPAVLASTAMSYAALQLLLSYVTYRAAKTQDQIAGATASTPDAQPVTAETIKRWMLRSGARNARSTPPSQAEFASVATAIHPWISAAPRDHPIHAVAAFVYAPPAPSATAVVKSDWLCATRWPWPASEIDHPTGAERLYGLHFLIRPSTDFVSAVGGQRRGLSLGTLNVIPHYVQAAVAPLFRLRQRNAAGTVSDIAGSIICQAGTLLFSGVGYLESHERTTNDTPFFASIEIGADIAEYRRHDSAPTNPGAERGPVQLRGQMHGRSKGAGAISTAFRTVYIPNSYMSPERIDDAAARANFYQLNTAAGDATGVFDRDRLDTALRRPPFNVALASKDLDEMWDRARDAQINMF